MDARLEELQTAPTNGCRVISTHDRVANMVFNADGGGSIMTTAELMEGDALIVRPLGDTMLVIAHWCSDTWERYHVRFPLEVVSVNSHGSMVGGSLLVHPNPVSDITNITYVLGESATIRLDVYDTIGLHVATLVNEVQVAGTHSVSYNAGSTPSGTYMVQLQTGSVSEVQTMLVVR